MLSVDDVTGGHHVDALAVDREVTGLLTDFKLYFHFRTVISTP